MREGSPNPAKGTCLGKCFCDMGAGGQASKRQRVTPSEVKEQSQQLGEEKAPFSLAAPAQSKVCLLELWLHGGVGRGSGEMGVGSAPNATDTSSP